MSEPISINFDGPIALFPLPKCVLLPHATIPLHIFEPRYRSMVVDAMDGDRLIAMAAFDGDAWKHDYEGAPPIRPIVCLGIIARHQELPDGRWNIVLRGLCRARVERELPHDPYRVAMLSPTEPAPAMEIDLDEHRRRLASLLADPVLGRLASVHAIHRWISPEAPTTAVVDLALMRLVDDPEQRYAMLAEPNIDARARWLEDQLLSARRLVNIASRHPARSDALEVTLN